MSLYNLLCGMNPNADQLLALVGLTRDDIERFRNVFVEEDGKTLCVYTRTGGNNRDDYPNEKMRRLDCWLRSEDDDFDSTYASDYLALPADAAERIAALNAEPQS